MTICTIRFHNDANGIYYAGQTLSGTVKLNLPEAKNFRGLRLTIKGAAKCEWKDKKKNQENLYMVPYQGTEQYLNQITYLFGCKGGKPEKLEAGVHTYCFLCFLPPELPYSVEAEFGYIRYKVVVDLEIPWGLDEKTVQRFAIRRHDDLNLLRDLKMTSKAEVVKTFCELFLASKSMLLEASIPYTGYIPGHAINVAIKVINETYKTVRKCQIELIRNTLYISEKNKKNCQSEVMTKVDGQGVEKKSSANFNVQLIVPSILTSTNAMYCEILQITYQLKVTCKTKGYHTNPEVFLPITLGNVPLYFGQPVNLPEHTTAWMPPPSFEQSINQSQQDLEAGRKIAVKKPTNSNSC